MVGIIAYYTTVIILKDYCVINESRVVGCGIGCIICTVYNLVIPRLEGVSIGVVCCLGRCCRNGYFITVVVSFGAQNSAVFILECYGVINVGRVIGCGVSCISYAINNVIIPARECIGIGIICCLYRSIGRYYLVTVTVIFFGYYTLVFAQKCHDEAIIQLSVKKISIACIYTYRIPLGKRTVITHRLQGMTIKKSIIPYA